MANRIALELVADANPLLKGLQQAQQSIDRFADAAADAGHAIGGGLSSAIDKFTNFSKGGAAAAGLLAGGMAAAAASAVALTASAGREVEAIEMMSQKTGIAVTTLQNWSVIMAENDFQVESLSSSMVTLSKKIGEARNPASEAAKLFKEMGLKAKDLGSTESLIRAVADRFAQMPDGIDKARYASELFGKAGLEWIPILNRGSKALDESKEAAKRFGADLNELQRSGLTNADDAMDRLGVAATALKQNLASVFAPAVEYGAQALAEVMGILARWAREVDTALDTLAIRITHIGLAAKELGAVLFSKDVIDPAAWRHAFDNISMIDKEAAKLIEKRRALAITPDTKGSDVALSASQSVAKTTKAAKPVLVRGDDQDAHIQEFKEVQQLTEQYRKGLIALSNQSTAALRKELDLYFETEKKIDIVTDQEAMGAAIVQQATEAWKHRNDELEMAADRAKVVDEAQQVLFQTEQGLIGASDIARMKRMELIAAEGALQKRVIEETIFDEKKKAAAILNLELQMDTRRRQAIQQFPSFFEQQMQAIVQSNSFSIGQITTTWTSGLANAAVNGGNFVEQAWKSTQVAVLQGLLNFGIQKAAQLALQASVELGIVSATAASVMGLNAAKNATIVAGDAAAATATTSIWAGAAAGITGTFAAVSGAIMGFFTATLIPFFVSIGTALMTFLSAIAAAASATIFGIPYGVAILAGVAIIGAAIGSLMAFADGGIVTGPTMGLIGEAGSSEAVIPLNKRGASFMRDALGGGGGGGPTTIIVELDGRVLARSVYDAMPSVLRMKGVRT